MYFHVIIFCQPTKYNCHLMPNTPVAAAAFYLKNKTVNSGGIGTVCEAETDSPEEGQWLHCPPSGGLFVL